MEPLEKGRQEYLVRRYYISRIETEEGQMDFVAVFSSGRGADTWDIQVTAYDMYEENVAWIRRGPLLYERPQK